MWIYWLAENAYELSNDASRSRSSGTFQGRHFVHINSALMQYTFINRMLFKDSY